MTVRISGSGQFTSYINNISGAIGTGPWTQMAWIRYVTIRGGSSGVAVINRFYVSGISGGGASRWGILKWLNGHGSAEHGSLGPATNTWYGLAVGRDGSDNAVIRVFDDDASMTLLATVSVSAASGTLQGSDVRIMFGDTLDPAWDSWPDCHLLNGRIVVGSYLTDAQVRDHLRAVDALGGEYGVWTLENHDGDGLTDRSGNGRHLTASSGTSTGTVSGPANYGRPKFAQTRSRWRADDGSETGATWLAAENTAVSRGPGQSTRCRVQVAATGDPEPRAFVLRYRRPGETLWRRVHLPA